MGREHGSGGGDEAAAGPGEQAGIGDGAGGQDALRYDGPDLLDEGDLAGVLALGPLAGRAAEAGTVRCRTVRAVAEEGRYAEAVGVNEE
ncbi:hypothetical protein RND61_21585 [Streptomyces sp. TRM76323]|uniref:Uncharacterized protein n=1 Tax=Streptomyces tamarix TaxID=3078565 RepID=A0ABU3QPF8_9ACTN|nr:hypothetical protein [Streptomyces tamarix]MDT9684627.1 hypothetical protein [Streptomyces tamarix]